MIEAALHHDQTSRPAPIDVFELRAWARARLYAEHVLNLQEAIDPLQADAEAGGLVAEIGVDGVQKILAREFGAAP